MIRLFSLNEGLITEMDFKNEGFADAISAASWVDVLSPTNEERNALAQWLNIVVPAADKVNDIEDSARCFIDQAGLHVYSLFLFKRSNRMDTLSVACILQRDKLITVRDAKLTDFRHFRMRAKLGHIESSNSPELLVSLLEQKVENLADALEKIHQRLEDVGTTVLVNSIEKPEDIVSLLAMSEDGNGKVRLCLMDTKRDISFLQRHLKFSPEVHEKCREIARDIDTLLSHTTFLFDKITFLMEFMQGHFSMQQNQIIKIISIAAVVFLPPTLVASIYGMNFSYMPELEWLLGYPWALGLMLISGFVSYWYFKRKDWL